MHASIFQGSLLQNQNEKRREGFQETRPTDRPAGTRASKKKHPFPFHNTYRHWYMYSSLLVVEQPNRALESIDRSTAHLCVRQHSLRYESVSAQTLTGRSTLTLSLCARRKLASLWLSCRSVALCTRETLKCSVAKSLPSVTSRWRCRCFLA